MLIPARLKLIAAITVSALAVYLLGGCSRPQSSAPQQTDDRTGVSQYSSEFPPPYHKHLLQMSEDLGR